MVTGIGSEGAVDGVMFVELLVDVPEIWVLAGPAETQGLT